MKKITILSILIVICCSSFLFAQVNEDDNDEVDNVNLTQSQGGLLQNVAQDRKMVKVGNVEKPEGLDVYVKRLMDDMQRSIESMDQRLRSIENDVKEVKEMLKTANQPKGLVR